MPVASPPTSQGAIQPMVLTWLGSVPFAVRSAPQLETAPFAAIERCRMRPAIWLEPSFDCTRTYSAGRAQPPIEPPSEPPPSLPLPPSSPGTAMSLPPPSPSPGPPPSPLPQSEP